MYPEDDTENNPVTKEIKMGAVWGHQLACDRLVKSKKTYERVLVFIFSKESYKCSHRWCETRLSEDRRRSEASHNRLK